MENNIEQLEEKVEIKKKGNKGLVVLVILLLLICCGLGAFIFINKDKLFEKEIKQVEKENKKDSVEKCDEVKVYETTDEKISKLIDDLIAGMDCYRLEIYANDKKVLSSDINANIAYDVAMYNSSKEVKEKITVDEINDIIKKYFGKDYKFEIDKLSDRKGTCISHYYDKSTKTFVSQETACGGTCGPHTIYEVVKAVDTNGILELDVRILFTDKNATGYYSNYKKTNLVQELDSNQFLQFEKGALYKFTFKNEDGNYVFVSSEPVN